MHGATESIRIENIVASTDIDQELALEPLANDLRAADYEPDHFPGLIYRLQEPTATALLFRSGKVVCTGATSRDDVVTALEQVFDDLRTLGITIAAAPDIEIQNIVSSADLGHQLNLNAMAIGLGLEDVEYEPEQFPGLVYRLAEPPVVALLFASGKLVLTGSKQVEDTEQALETISDRLTELGLRD